MMAPARPTAEDPRRTPKPGARRVWTRTLPAAADFADAQARTRFVNTAKVALPASAALLIAAIVIWPMFSSTPEVKPTEGNDSARLEMVDARYLGLDGGRRPFEVRAERADQVGTGTVVSLTNPEAQMVLGGGKWLTIAAERGEYDQQSGKLRLQGNVTLFHDGGYEFSTPTAELDTVKGLAWGNSPVSGQGPIGRIDAGGFRVLQNGATVVFTGKARLNVTPGAGGRSGNGGAAGGAG